MIPSAHALSKRYHELPVPVVIMAGASDLHAIPASHSERLHSELPQSELILVPDVGHMVPHSATEQVFAAIDSVATPAYRPEPREYKIRTSS